MYVYGNFVSNKHRKCSLQKIWIVFTHNLTWYCFCFCFFFLQLQLQFKLCAFNLKWICSFFFYLYYTSIRHNENMVLSNFLFVVFGCIYICMHVFVCVYVVFFNQILSFWRFTDSGGFQLLLARYCVVPVLLLRLLAGTAACSAILFLVLVVVYTASNIFVIWRRNFICQ